MPNRVTTAARHIWRHSTVRYLFVGGLCFAVDVALLWFAHDVLSVPLTVATPVSFLASFAVTYTLQRMLAFTSNAGVVTSVARYTALVIFNALATTAIVWLMDTMSGSWLVGKIIAVAVTTLWNYFAYRHWVFATPRPRSTDV